MTTATLEPSNHVAPKAASAPPSASKYDLGVNYMFGRNGLAADLGMAAASFLDAADDNDARGIYAAGMMYLKGIGVTRNDETAFDYLRRSAALGHAPARDLLAAINHGQDVSAAPIVVTETAKRKPAALAPGKSAVMPGRMLAIVVAVIAALAVAGTVGYQVWSAQATKRDAAAAEQVHAAEVARAAAAEQLRVQTEERDRLTQEAKAANDRAAAAQAEAEAAKQQASASQADLAAQAEALREREAALAQPAPRAPEPAPAPNAAVGSDWNAMLAQERPYLIAMMNGALQNRPEATVDASTAIRSLPQPVRGDRKLARGLNKDALAAMEAGDQARAVSSLNAAVAADSHDEEIATNLGYALVKQGRPADALVALQRALYVNPTRSSAWYNVGLAYLAQGKEAPAYASLLLTFEFAGVPQKSRDWFEKLAQDATDPALQRLAQRVLASPIVAASGTTAAPK